MGTQRSCRHPSCTLQLRESRALPRVPLRFPAFNASSSTPPCTTLSSRVYTWKRCRLPFLLDV
eukprot:2436696-Prymnesium_polylepis.1